eukprot:g1971.t1
MIAQPLHASTMQGLAKRYAAFTQVVRLAKTWLATHLLSQAFHEETIELLVASLFTNSLPLLPPQSGSSGFLRFLRLLSTFAWSSSPLIVDAHRELSARDTQMILDCFREFRKRYGRDEFPMWIITAQDWRALTKDMATVNDPQGGSVAGQDGISLDLILLESQRNQKIFLLPSHTSSSAPSKVHLARTIALANYSYHVLSRKTMVFKPKTWRSIFRTHLGGYHILFTINKDYLGLRKQRFDVQEKTIEEDGGEGEESSTTSDFTCSSLYVPIFKNLRKGSANEQRLLVGMDLLETFTADIEARYGKIVDIFVNKLGWRTSSDDNDNTADITVGLVVKETFLEKFPFRVSRSQLMKPLVATSENSESSLLFDSDQFVNEIRARWGDFVQDVTMNIEYNV